MHSSGERFENIMEKVLLNLFGNNIIREKPIEVNKIQRKYRIDFVINNTFFVELKYFRSAKVSSRLLYSAVYAISSIVEEINTNVDEYRDKNIFPMLIVSSIIEEKQKKDLKNKYNNIILWDRNDLLKFTDKIDFTIRNELLSFLESPIY